MVFSGGGPGLLAVTAVITKQSPEVTALTLPLYHPVAAVPEDAIATAPCTEIYEQTNEKEI